MGQIPIDETARGTTTMTHKDGWLQEIMNEASERFRKLPKVRQRAWRYQIERWRREGCFVELADVCEGPDSHRTTTWEDDSIQFPRLLSEILNTQGSLDWEALEDMDLSRDQIEELFDRADARWQAIKRRI